MLWWALTKGYGSGTLRKHPRSIVRITAERSMPDFWLAPIYIYHNIIAVHMYGILFCIPIIYLIFPQILQFTRILSIYPDIVLTTLHILSIYIYIYIYIYIFWGPYIFPIATRATRTAHRGGASSTARVAWSFSLRIIPGAGWPGMFVEPDS